jgi:hypothetical protein
MTINTAIEYLNTLQKNTADKGEIKVYQKFTSILIGLENRDFSKYQISLIETELKTLDLEKQTKNRKRYIKKKSNEFVNFLKSEFSIVMKSHYANLGLSMGMVFGVAIGVSVFKDSGSSTTGMCFGMFIGYLIGQYMDKEAEKENQVLIIS